MSETCTNCRHLYWMPAESLKRCFKHKTHLPPGCRGCDDFERRRDKYEACERDIKDAYRQGVWVGHIVEILRKHFPPQDREAIQSALDDQFRKKAGPVAMCNAVLAALEKGGAS